MSRASSPLLSSVPRPKPLNKVFRALRKHDKRFEIFFNRGKGGHVMIEHPSVNGKPVSFALPNHRGKDIGRGLLSGLIREFKLPRDIFGL